MTGHELDAAWADRQARLASLRCVNGHRFERRWSMHLGSWKACLRCGLIHEVPALVVVR